MLDVVEYMERRSGGKDNTYFLQNHELDDEFCRCGERLNRHGACPSCDKKPLKRMEN